MSISLLSEWLKNPPASKNNYIVSICHITIRHSFLCFFFYTELLLWNKCVKTLCCLHFFYIKHSNHSKQFFFKYATVKLKDHNV